MNSRPSAPLLDLLVSRRRGVLVTLKRDGRPQLSVVSFHAHPDPDADPDAGIDTGTALVRVSTRDPLAKTRNLRRDPRVSLQAATDDHRAYVVAEGEAELGPVARDPRDAVVDELVEHYRTLNGEHPDWEEFRAAMVAEERLVVRFVVRHLYGVPPA